MKSFLKIVNSILLEIERTRAAAALARLGKHAEAKAVMLAK